MSTKRQVRKRDRCVAKCAGFSGSAQKRERERKREKKECINTGKDY